MSTYTGACVNVMHNEVDCFTAGVELCEGCSTIDIDALPDGLEGAYLVHFDTAYMHAEHYAGWSSDIKKRIKAHRDGNGARLMSVIKAAGISWRVVRIWPGATRDQERLMHRQGPKRLCPVCDARAMKHKTIESLNKEQA